MSLILDALRKSEAERRRGQAPDLFTPAVARSVPNARPGVALLLTAAFALLVATGIAFWPHSNPSTPATTTTRPAETVSTPAQRDVTPVPTTSTTRVTKPIPRPSPPALVAASKPVAPRPAMDNRPVEVFTVPATAAASSDTDAMTAPIPDAPDAAPADSPDNEPALPSLATLDSATRAQLPPLQLSMHVWNADATRRFAIIDGQRLGEGGRLAGVVVTEIRRDGVVLDIDGRQFLLPRP